MRRDCSSWARSCLHCQRAKVNRHVTSAPGLIATPQLRFRHIHIDIIGPLPPAGPYRYCLTAIDRFSRWPEALPLEDITAERVAAVFFAGWISRFGTPETVTTDQGRQFESQLFKALGVHAGFKRARTTSYHPCANGMIERLHRQLKAAIMCHPNSTWLEGLPVALLGIRSAFKDDLKTTAAELMYGEPLRLPGEMISPAPTTAQNIDHAEFINRLQQQMNHLRPTPASNHKKTNVFVFKELATCTHVFLREDALRSALQAPYTGPYPVIQRDDNTVVIRIRGTDTRVSIDRLKPAYTIADDAVGTPTVADDATRTPTTSAPTFPNTSTPPPEKYTTRAGRRVRFKLPFDL